MKINRIILLLLVMQVCIGAFPRVVWTYVPDQADMTVLQKLCVYNLRRHAQELNIPFRFLTNNNYTLVFEDWHQIDSISKMSHLDQRVTLSALIQLKVLHKYGGIWIDATSMLTESLMWLQTLEEANFVNNRLQSPEVVMFYESSWFDRTEKNPKEKIVVLPAYHSWFMTATKGSLFIQDLNTLLIQTLIVSYQNLKTKMNVRGIQVEDYIQDPTKFLPWLISTIVNLKQKQLDRQKSLTRKLAVDHYQISAVDSSQTAFIIDQHGRGFVDLTTKYLAQLTPHQLLVTPTYLIKISPSVQRELLQTLETDYVDLDHFHAAAQLLCDGAQIPLRYVVRDSIIEKYLLRDSDYQQINVFEEEYIQHHCNGSFVESYLQFGKLLLIVIAAVIHVYVTRKAILFFKPQWGKRRRQIQFEEAGAESE